MYWFIFLIVRLPDNSGIEIRSLEQAYPSYKQCNEALRRGYPYQEKLRVRGGACYTIDEFTATFVPPT